MKEKTKTLLESLMELQPERDIALVVESRGTNIISSAIALIETIQNEFGDELAHEIERRLILSIRGKDDTKFKRGAKKLR